jgi:hypothetical protein
MVIAFCLILLLHALIHLMGFVKAFGYAELPQLKCPIPRPVGLLWLLATLLLVSALLLFIGHSGVWWFAAAAGTVVSQIVIILSWKDARFGTILNFLILVPVVVAFTGSLPSSLQNRYRAESEKRLTGNPQMQMVTEEDIRHCPPQVQRYLRYAGVIGKPMVRNFRARFRGEMKRTVGGSWMEIHASQYDFFDDPARIFYIEGSLFGVPFNGLHCYRGGEARMEISVAALVPVADARGEKMNRSETVTFFNDMCLIAPATLVDTSIRWEQIDPSSVKAVFSNGGNTITATLIFGENGELMNFSSDDRYLSPDGVSYENYPWETPVLSYGDFGNRTVADEAEAKWLMPEGDYLYARFTLESVEYNCTDFQ